MTLSDQDFRRLADFVQSRYGINLTGKRTLIESRLAFDISRRGFNSFNSYIDVVTRLPNGSECQHMINRLSTNYSFFFRDTNYISHLKNRAIPDLLRNGSSRLSIWSAGCSNGQEAYSIAMVLSSAGCFAYHITGTDINTDVLETAKAGLYPEEDLQGIPDVYRRYVRLTGGGQMEIVPELRNHISWARENMMEIAFPTPEYDIVFCRNVLIYFAPETRKRIADMLYGAVRPGGYLYTGAMEAMDFKSRKFNYIAPSIYQKGANK